MMPELVNKAYAALQDEWDIDTTDFTQLQHRTLNNQQAFLTAYGNRGTMMRAAKDVGIDRYTAQRWRDNDVFRFKERLLQAHVAFCDMLEDKAVNLATKLKPGQNSLILVTLLNANLPDKYRPNSVIPSETMTDTLREMKQATREHRRLADGSETTIETVTEVTVKPGLQAGTEG